MNLKNMTAIVLAAGKGTRINAKKINKVMYPLAGKPMIGYTVGLLKKVGFEKIVIVVGFKKESIINYLGKGFIYSHQKKRLGTAHAVKCALDKIPTGTKNVFICYSDDTSFYPPSVIKKLVNFHLRNKQDLTLLTLIKKEPFGLGRIIRNSQGEIRAIIEEKSASKEQKKIKEINTGCYCFNLSFLKKYLLMVKKNPLKGEYYLTDIVDLAIKDNKKVIALKIEQGDYFQGVNTKEQLIEADRKMRRKRRNESA
jgi:bifunctional UDP-N-acetylglucosamine pyrophosphorylase/glucosamine-1-phosphate N-acetyltransferase